MITNAETTNGTASRAHCLGERFRWRAKYAARNGSTIRPAFRPSHVVSSLSLGTPAAKRLEPAARAAHRLVVLASKELLPEPAAVLARELAGQVVDLPEPLHRDQEAFVGREPRGVQVGDLLAKVVLELVDVAAVDAGRSPDVGTPLCDLRFECLHRQASRAVSRQTSLSARVTATHCCWCSASAVRPSSVIA